MSDQEINENTPSEHLEQASHGRDTIPGVTREVYSRNADAAKEARAAEFAIHTARTLFDDKCTDVLVLDVRGRSQLTDYLVIASGTSERQMRSAGSNIEDEAQTRDITLHRSNLKEREANWVLLDFVDVVVHIFEPETRLFYDLEMLWGDAERVFWAREDQQDAVANDPARNRAGLRPDDVLPE
ncbi:MAG: ribosome silencing factor [Planctomycetota bacterium]